VGPNIYFEVIAEDMVTTIVYQLQPQATADDAFVTSDLLNVNQSQSLISNVPGGVFVSGGGINVSKLLSMLIPCPGATMKLVDKAGNQRMDGKVIEDDKVVVTSESGTTTKVYYLSFIPNAVVKSTTYLAYILSNVYMVDQVNYKVDVDGATPSISEFYGKITAAMGATAVVVDSEGNEKTTGNIAESDMVKVTSADGKIEVMYSFGAVVSARAIDARNIKLYPNPTDAVINISGLETGGRIKVFNALGMQVRDIRIQRNIESISLNEQPSGLYLIVVSDSEKMLGRYKVLKK
jgi:D-arabinose 5-phosphate isomerase GutQ